MPKSSLTSKAGRELLQGIRDREAHRIAVRTALAIARLPTETVDDSEAAETVPEAQLQESSSDPFPSGGAQWARHDFDRSGLLVFSRREGEILTIRRSPTGEGWFIDYDGPVDSWPL